MSKKHKKAYITYTEDNSVFKARDFWRRYSKSFVVILVLVALLATGVFLFKQFLNPIKTEMIGSLTESSQEDVAIANAILFYKENFDYGGISELKALKDDSISYEMQIGAMKRPGPLTEQEFLTQYGQFNNFAKRINPWKEAFFSCYTNATFKKNVTYLGPSNKRYLGTILSSDMQQTRRELTYLIPEEDFKFFASIGVKVVDCNVTNIKGLTIGAILNSSILAKVNAQLSLDLSDSDSVNVTGGEWQIDYLRTEDFLEYLNKSKDSRVESYRTSLLKKKSFVITQVVKVSGFTAEINSSKNVRPALDVETKPIKIPNSQIDSTHLVGSSISFHLKMDKSNKRRVYISSDQPFYIFGMVQKGVKLVE